MALAFLTLLLALGSSGQEQTALRISIAPVETPDAKPSNPQFVITLENQGAEDFVVVLGAVVGRTLYPHALDLLLTDGNGRQSRLRFRGPARVGGRVDPYIVGLPGGADYRLRVSLAQFTRPYTGRTAPPAKGDLDPRLPPGIYSIQATLQPPGVDATDVHGNTLMNLWTTAVSSNLLRFSAAQLSGGDAQSPVPSEERGALIKALYDEALRHRRHDVASRRGEKPPPLVDPERIFPLVSAVAKLHDPGSIPALAAALGTGFGSIRALSAFGQQAVPAILAEEASQENGTSAVNHALIALRSIVEDASARGGLPEAMVGDLRRVAARRLAARDGSPTTLWWAIDLAWSLRDKELQQSLYALSSDASVIVERGITDPQLIEQTQRRAADRVAGIPPLPRP